MKAIANLEPQRQALIKYGSRHSSILNIDPSPFELKLFSTDEHSKKKLDELQKAGKNIVNELMIETEREKNNAA